MRRNNSKIVIVLSVIALVLLVTTGIVFFMGKDNTKKVSEASPSISSVAQASPSDDLASNSAQVAGKTDDKKTDDQKKDETTTKPSNNANSLQLKPSIEEIKVKAIYLTGSSASLSKKVDEIIDIANKTELNSIVLDIKEDGVVNYASEVDMVKKNGTMVKMYNPDTLVKKLHDNGIYVIGRIVVFKDSKLAVKRADLAIKNKAGQVWKENGTTPWINPYNEESWDYNISIAKEAIAKGFDEIQFDYVRFPTGKKSDFNFGANAPSKADAINGFLARAEKELHEKLGVPVSADVFAIISDSRGDGESIGQRIEEVGKDIYCLNPMIYPSHYANNAAKGAMSNGVGQAINGVLFTKPDLEPYKVVFNAVKSTTSKTSAVTGYKAKIRPYIQAFTAKYLPAGYFQTYGPKQIREQIQGIYDAGCEEWILWDARNKYQEAFFLPEIKK